MSRIAFFTNGLHKLLRWQSQPCKAVAIAKVRFARLASTWHGRSGREYTQQKVIRLNSRTNEFTVCLAQSDGKQYIVKKVSDSVFELSQELRHEFGSDGHLRVHVDENEEENLLFYECFREDLLSFIGRQPELSLQTRKQILRGVALALKALHSKDWIHLDLKPDNVLVDWETGPEDGLVVKRVALADLDCALHLHGSHLFNHRIGNVMWRSPEGQAGKGVGKPSEIFSFGLMCIYTISGAEILHPNFEQLKKDGTEPEHVISYKLLSMFGPTSPGLLAHIDDPDWNELLTALSEAIEEEDDDSQRFERWAGSLLPNMDIKARALILRMTQLDPSKRIPIDEVLEDPWWR